MRPSCLAVKLYLSANTFKKCMTGSNIAASRRSFRIFIRLFILLPNIECVGRPVDMPCWAFWSAHVCLWMHVFNLEIVIYYYLRITKIHYPTHWRAWSDWVRKKHYFPFSICTCIQRKNKPLQLRNININNIYISGEQLERFVTYFINSLAR